MTETHRIKVMLVDDHGMVRKGLAAFLSNAADLLLAGEARDGQEAVELCETVQPDVVLMDLVMPKMDGVTATRRIRERWPETQVVALTSFQERELVRDALQAGAISYLLKDVSGDALADAIRAAHAGRSTLSAEAVQALVREQQEELLLTEPLTEREAQVLEWLVQGMENPEIALKLTISPSTVKVHVSNILSKMGVSNRKEAIALALKHGLPARKA